LDIAVTRALETLAYPPAGPLLIAAAGALLWRRWPRTGGGVFALAWLYLYVASIPLTAAVLAERLERFPPLQPREVVARGAEAIVVLGGDLYLNAVEYQGSTVGPAAMMRLRYGASLHRKTGLPLAVTSGDPLEIGVIGGELMARVLRRELDTPVRWVEKRSRNTFENARFTAGMLRADGIERVALVSHAWHLPRARAAFERHGMEVVPAPTAFYRRGPLQRGAFAFLPDDDALSRNTWYVHELIGRLWYALFY